MPISKTCAYFKKQCIRKLYCAYFHRKCLFFIYGVIEVSLHFHSQKFLSEKLNQPTENETTASEIQQAHFVNAFTDIFELFIIMIYLKN